jgi:hypothetical protein
MATVYLEDILDELRDAMDTAGNARIDPLHLVLREVVERATADIFAVYTDTCALVTYTIPRPGRLERFFACYNVQTCGITWARSLGDTGLLIANCIVDNQAPPVQPYQWWIPPNPNSNTPAAREDWTQAGAATTDYSSWVRYVEKQRSTKAGV